MKNLPLTLMKSLAIFALAGCYGVSPQRGREAEKRPEGPQVPGRAWFEGHPEPDASGTIFWI